jgi:hypothetical protein
MGLKKFWDDLWKREEEFITQGKRDLRHGVSSVGVSTLAGQFYCEYKVENEFALGEIATEAKEEGTLLHDELIPMKPISKDGFVKLVSQKRPSYAVLRVWGELADIRLVGEPDHIIWSEEKPLWLVELKTTAGDPKALWDDQLNQILIYGALLEKMGFDCSKLRLALVRIRAKELSDEQKRAWIVPISKNLEQGLVRELEAEHRGAMKVHLIDHDVHAAELGVRRMQGYWLKEREATSSTSIGKCRACEYNPVCSKTLYEPS